MTSNHDGFQYSSEMLNVDRVTDDQNPVVFATLRIPAWSDWVAIL